MSGDEPGRGLTRRQFDAVIRRAAELASSEAEGSEGGLSEAEVYRIAGEVGLDARHVRVALGEVRDRETRGLLDPWFGPTVVGASRVVPGTPRDLARTLDDFFVASQLLQAVRRGGSVLQYRPALDWVSQLARTASLSSRKHYVASSKWVEVHLEAVDPHRCIVAIRVDPGTRNDQVMGALVGGGTAGIGVGVGSTLLLATVAPLAAGLAVGVVAGGALAAGIARVSGHSHLRKLEEVRAEVEGILDRLEADESLEPPPASWRRWVKRHFHGVARDLGRSDPEDPEEY